MYCPRCSQLSAEGLRFCPRCGLPLDLIAELVANDGALAAREVSSGVKKPLLQRKGARIGAKLMFSGIVLLPLLFGLALFVDSPGPLLLPCLIFLAGLSRLLYTLIFGETATLEPRAPQPAMFNPAAHQFSLPATPSAPVSSFDFGRRDTAETVQPASVTEHTTRLLDRNAEESFDPKI